MRIEQLVVVLIARRRARHEREMVLFKINRLLLKTTIKLGILDSSLIMN